MTAPADYPRARHATRCQDHRSYRSLRVRNGPASPPAVVTRDTRRSARAATMLGALSGCSRRLSDLPGGNHHLAMSAKRRGQRANLCGAPARALVVSCLVCVCAGCGGPITDDELQRAIQTLGATAAEGRLVALDAAEDRTKVTFERVELRDLGDDAEHDAEKLNDAQAQPANAAVKAQAVKLAQAVSEALGELQVAPADRRVARRVQLRLDALSQRADALTSQL